MPRRTRPPPRPRIHSCPKVNHPRLGLPPISRRDSAGVLLEDVQQDHRGSETAGRARDSESARTGPVAPATLPRSATSLGTPAVDRAGRGLQMLLDGVIDLCSRERLCTQQSSRKSSTGSCPRLVSIEDGLRTPARAARPALDRELDERLGRGMAQEPRTQEEAPQSLRWHKNWRCLSLPGRARQTELVPASARPRVGPSF